MIIPIKDLSEQELSPYFRLTEAQLRQDSSLFIAESPNVIAAALSAGYTPVSMLMQTKHAIGKGREIISLCGDIPVYTADGDILTKITGFELARGILCAMKRKPLPTLDDVCKNAKKIAVLEHVSDAANIGSVFRAAAALGVDGILISGDCTEPLNRRAARVSMGGVFRIPWTVYDSWYKDGAERLKSLDFSMFALALSDNSVSITDKRLKECKRCALLFGSEGEGLSKDTISNCDCTVKIPMFSGMDSLNVAQAAAVAFWEIFRR